MHPRNQAANKAQRKGAWALWIGVVIMFLIVISAWTVLIKIAREHPVEQVEIEVDKSKSPD